MTRSIVTLFSPLSRFRPCGSVLTVRQNRARHVPLAHSLLTCDGAAYDGCDMVTEELDRVALW